MKKFLSIEGITICGGSEEVQLRISSAVPKCGTFHVEQMYDTSL